MAIVTVWETAMVTGTINTEHTFTRQHNFPAPGVNLWSRPYLQSINVYDSDAAVKLTISKFVDKDGSHTGSYYPSIFAEGCTSVTFRMWTSDCIATAVLTTEIFG